METIDHLNQKCISDCCKNELFTFCSKVENEANGQNLFDEKLRKVIGKNSKYIVRN